MRAIMNSMGRTSGGMTVMVVVVVVVVLVVAVMVGGSMVMVRFGEVLA